MFKQGSLLEVRIRACLNRRRQKAYRHIAGTDRSLQWLICLVSSAFRLCLWERTGNRQKQGDGETEREADTPTGFVHNVLSYSQTAAQRSIQITLIQLTVTPPTVWQMAHKKICLLVLVCTMCLNFRLKLPKPIHLSSTHFM